MSMLFHMSYAKVVIPKDGKLTNVGLVYKKGFKSNVENHIMFRQEPLARRGPAD